MVADKQLQICHMCRKVRDDRETAYERWIPKHIYRQNTGIDAANCRLAYTYCPACYTHVVHKIGAA